MKKGYRVLVSAKKIRHIYYIGLRHHVLETHGFPVSYSRVIFMGMKEAVVRRLCTICQQRNIALNQLANISGVTPSTIYSFMRSDRKDIGIVTLKKLCDGLEISMEEFFHDSSFESLGPELK